MTVLDILGVWYLFMTRQFIPVYTVAYTTPCLKLPALVLVYPMDSWELFPHSLDWVMVFYLFGAKPLPLPMLNYHPLNVLGINFSEFNLGMIIFHLKMLSAKWWTFCTGLKCITNLSARKVIPVDFWVKSLSICPSQNRSVQKQCSWF